jgi:hypothetical protein
MKADRRAFVGLLGATAALLPFGATVRAAPPFAPPAGAMRFSRSLRRELADGAAVVATRVFAVQFVAEAAGWRLEGEESEPPQVTGPPSFEPFAKLERGRRETGMFPMTLDAAGKIVARPAPEVPQGLDEAVTEALHRIAASGRGEDEQAAMRTFVLGLQQAAATLVSLPPDDLFHPLSTPLSESRDVQLPDGRVGSVSLSFTATIDPATGLMREAERAVLTRLADSERRTIERWTLAPA